MESFFLRTKTRHRFYLEARRRAIQMADAFGLQKLHDYLTGKRLIISKPVWIMGICFRNKLDNFKTQLDDKVVEELLRHFQSIMYLTYRLDFPQLGPEEWTSDAGWGCTIRSGQMMIAQACLNHLKPRTTKLTEMTDSQVSKVVNLFWDSPLESHIFSVHQICQNASRLGVNAGNWMGPGFVCRILAEILGAHHPLNLHVALISQPVGAPYITPDKINELKQIFPEESTGEIQDIPSSSENLSESLPPGLVILVPLLLGTSTMNARYMFQMKQTLTWTQSIGIVGGRSSSSLYLVGYQGDQILFLDPHRIQPTTSSPEEIQSYFNASLRLMPQESVITSLSIGFYCKDRMELEDLVFKLQQLEKDSKGAPIISFPDKDIPNIPAPSSSWSLLDGELDDDDDDLNDWELV